MTENDDAWKPFHRESWADIQTRVARFLAWLVQRPESCVAVVSHGVWIETLLRAYAPEVLEGGQRVHNCDVFCCHILSKDGAFVRIERTQHISGRQAHHR
jgi:broad specificity phosphatase PhoE